MPETSSHASAASPTSTALDQSGQSHLDGLYRAAIGPIGTDYYLPILARFEFHGRASPSWNWAACACTLSWMVFRGLWLAALAYLGAVGAAVAVLGIALTLTDPPVAESLRWGLWAGLATLALLVPGLFGNAWLYRSYRQRLDNALADTSNLRDACMLLTRQSCTRPRLVAVLLANLALAAVLAVGFWPTAMPIHMWPRVSGEVENSALAAVSPARSAPASVAAPARKATASEPVTGVTAKPPSAAPSEPMPPIAQPQAAAFASQGVARPAWSDFDLQTLGPAARGALSQDAAVRQHSRSARHPPPAVAAVANATIADASTAPAQGTVSAPVNREPTPPSPDRSQFLINVGLFAQQDNALRVHARLKAAGLPATSTSLETRNGPRTRVRVGPFTGRDQADAAAQRIRAMQLDAVVIRQ